LHILDRDMANGGGECTGPPRPTRLLAAATSRTEFPTGRRLIARARNYEGQSKDYEFSRLSMQDHWRAGYHDAVRTLRHPEVLERPRSRDGIFVFDFHKDGRE
jgi:NTE family protein